MPGRRRGKILFSLLPSSFFLFLSSERKVKFEKGKGRRGNRLLFSLFLSHRRRKAKERHGFKERGERRKRGGSRGPSCLFLIREREREGKEGGEERTPARG